MLNYFVEGGPLWLALTVAIVLALLTGVAGWFAGGLGERLGRDWRDSRSRKR